MKILNALVPQSGLLLVTCLLLAQPLSAQDDVKALVESFKTDEHYLYRVLDTQFSTSALVRVSALYDAWESELASVDVDALDSEGRVDWVLMNNTRASEVRQVADQWGDITRDTPFLPFANDVVQLTEERRTGHIADGRIAASRLADIRKAVKTGRKAFDVYFDAAVTNNAPVSTNEIADAKAPKETMTAAASATRFHARETAHLVNRLKKNIESWYNHYSTFQPGFKWWVEAEWNDTKKALEEYHKHLREKRAGIKGDTPEPLLGRPIGETRLNALIHEEMIAYDARELLAIGERELAWCESEMAKVAEELGTDCWSNTLSRIKDKTVPPGAQAELVSQYVTQTVDFLKQKSLLYIPRICEESWRVDMVSKDAQKHLPYALYSSPNVRVAYATRGMTHDAMQMSMRGNNLHATRIVVAHEIIPGHHYQIYMAKKQRTYRERFRTSFLVEGWALYWEMRLWDQGYARNAEDRAGMLFWRAHRCARVILTLKYHLGDIQPNAMVNELVDRIGHERDQATAEVRRYINANTGVLYQVSYMIGGLQLKALWQECVVEGGMSEIDFHNAVVQQGPIPVEMIRAAIQKTKLSRDFTPQWRF